MTTKPNTVRLSISLDKETYNKIKAKAAHETVSQYIRHLIQKDLV